MRRKLDPASLRAAWWALVAFRRTRRALRRERVTDVVVAPPPALPVRAGRGVRAVLRRADATCLERALVLQAWEAAHGPGRDVVIGVKGGEKLAAHAWLDGEADGGLAYEELMRVPAR
ncbi:MAG TPA: lasso peptide biosynthesis B2 protein [Gaiellaceae bacterium]